MGCIGTPPDSDYARHVLQVNMKLHALSGVPVPPGVAPYKSLNNRSLLLYSQPQFPTCVAVPVPLMTALQLATVLDGPMSIVSRLRALPHLLTAPLPHFTLYTVLSPFIVQTHSRRNLLSNCGGLRSDTGAGPRLRVDVHGRHGERVRGAS